MEQEHQSIQVSPAVSAIYTVTVPDSTEHRRVVPLYQSQWVSEFRHDFYRAGKWFVLG